MKSKYRLIPAGTKIWALTLQLTIILCQDVLVEPDMICDVNGKYIYGKLIHLPAALPGYLQCYIPIPNADIGIYYDETLPWKRRK